MNEDFDILPVEMNDRVRNTSTPYMQLRLNGNSYLNEKAARLLGFTTGSLIRFHRSRDLTKWYISSDPVSGAIVRKNSGLYKFCAVTEVRQIFKVFGINGVRADFPLSNGVEELRGPDGLPLVLVAIFPNPYNIA